jgi:hypothetical protein
MSTDDARDTDSSGDRAGSGGGDRRRQVAPPDTVNRESHPSAAGPEGLAGDLGISSERHGPFEGIDGTGSLASAQASTDGESPTVDDADGDVEPAVDVVPEQRPSIEGQPAPDKPDETAEATGVDRTVGEVKPDPVANPHQFDPSKNPRH